MACTKHVHRKRYNSCPDCQAELNGKKDEKVQTSREMLAELTAMEEEVDKIVIKKTRRTKVEKAAKEEKVEVKKHEVKLVITEDDVNNPSEAVKHLANQYGVAKKELDDLIDVFFHAKIADIDEYFAKKLAEFKLSISSLSNVQFQHLYIPLTTFRVSMINELEKQGWGYKEMWIGNVAKVSGCDEDVVVFTRVKNPKWPDPPKNVKGKVL